MAPPTLGKWVLLALVLAFFVVDPLTLGRSFVVPVKPLPPRATIESDEDAQCLLQNHPELQPTVNGSLAAAKQLYADTGFAQGLSGACPQSDEDALMYLTAYQDLNAVLGNDPDRIRKAKEHWLKYGWRQGRVGHARYNLALQVDATGRAQQDAHKPFAESMYWDPAKTMAEKKAKEEAKAAQAASAMNKVVHLKSVLTGNACATDAQGSVACHGGSGKEAFQVEKMAPDTFVLRTNRTNQYCQVDGASRVVCNVGSYREASQFGYVQLPGLPGNRFRMVSPKGQPCDHDPQGLVCNLPTDGDGGGGLEYEVVSTSIQTDNVQTKINAVLEEKVQPRIHTTQYGERAYGKEEEAAAASLSLIAKVGIASAAVLVGVGGAVLAIPYIKAYAGKMKRK